MRGSIQEEMGVPQLAPTGSAPDFRSFEGLLQELTEDLGIDGISGKKEESLDSAGLGRNSRPSALASLSRPGKTRLFSNYELGTKIADIHSNNSMRYPMKHQLLKTGLIAGILALGTSMPSQACSILNFRPPSFPNEDIKLIFNQFELPMPGPNSLKFDGPPSPEAVPEPGTLALMGMGVLALAGAAHRSRKKQLP